MRRGVPAAALAQPGHFVCSVSQRSILLLRKRQQRSSRRRQAVDSAARSCPQLEHRLRQLLRVGGAESDRRNAPLCHVPLSGSARLKVRSRSHVSGDTLVRTCARHSALASFFVNLFTSVARFSLPVLLLCLLVPSAHAPILFHPVDAHFWDSDVKFR